MAVSTTAAFASGQTVSVQDAVAGAALITMATNAAAGPIAAGQAYALPHNTRAAIALDTHGDAVCSGTGSIVATFKQQSSPTAPALAFTAAVPNKAAATVLLADNGARKRFVLFNNSAATANHTFQLVPGQPYETTDRAGPGGAVWSAVSSIAWRIA